MGLGQKLILRIALFGLLVGLSVVVGWWLFVPLSLIYAILVRRAYEIMFIGTILDGMYYFGPSFWQTHLLLLVAAFFVVILFVLEQRVNLGKLV